jgi:hypothetical protein
VAIVAELIGQLGLIFEMGLRVQAGYPDEPPTESSGLTFTGRMYFYCESPIGEPELKALVAAGETRGLSLRIRGARFAEERSRMEKPLAFICHDSRNKEAIAKPIALGLAKLMCPVWFDEFSLNVGDRLRESIEKGLKECKKCVLILSPEFFANTGWTRAEFNSIFTRGIIEKKDFVLPVWA